MIRHIGLVLILVALAFPRYESSVIARGTGHVVSVTDLGHHFLLSPPSVPPEKRFGAYEKVSVNLQQYILTLLFASAIAVALRFIPTPRSEPGSSERNAGTRRLPIRYSSLCYGAGLIILAYSYQARQPENILATRIQIGASALGQLVAMLGFSGIVYFIFRASSKDYAIKNRPHIIAVSSLITFGLMVLGK